MKTHSPHTGWLKRSVVAVATAVVALGPASAIAASSWAPTLLVNTESFQEIDTGDGTTDIELRFGSSTQTLKFLTTNRFQFSHSISVLGTLSGSALNVDHNATIGGNLTVSGSLSLANGGGLNVRGNISGYTLRVSGAADINGPLGSSGAIRTESGVVINSDLAAKDAVLVFGNSVASQTLKYLNTDKVFQFSAPISVLGTISGSSLNVDRNATVGGTLTVTGSIITKGTLSGSSLTLTNNATINGSATANTITATTDVIAKGNLSGRTLTVSSSGFTLNNVKYTAPVGQGAANTFLKNDGNGNLTWTATSVNNTSGGIISLHPVYPNAVYFGSGTTKVGQLVGATDTTNLENYYRWTTSKGTLQDYWVSVRVRLPNTFAAWDSATPIQFRYRTSDGTAANNALTVKMKDTAGADVALTGAASLANAAWTTASITGPQSSGTWTPGSYITVYVKLSSITAKFADAGFINLRFSTFVP